MDFYCCIMVNLSTLVEHAAVNRRVVGSSPTGGAKKVRRYDTYGLFHFVFYLFSQANLLGFFHSQGFLNIYILL